MACAINVTNLAGQQLCSVNLQQDCRVHDLKLAIQGRTSIRYHDQRLVTNGEVLNNQALLVDVLGEDSPEGIPEVTLVQKVKNIDYDYWRSELERDGKRLSRAPNEIREDKEFVLLAVRQCGELIKFALGEARHDPDVGREAVRQDASCVKYVDEVVCSDRKLMLSVIQQDGALARYVLGPLLGDREFVLTAMSRPGGCVIFPHVTKELTADKEIAWMAVTNYGAWLSRVSPDLLGNRDLVLQAIRHSRGLCLKDIHEDLRQDRDLVVENARQGWTSLHDLPDNMKADKELAMLVLPRSGQQLQFLAEELKDDRELVLIAVQKDCCSLKFASKRLRNDREIVLSACPFSFYALLCADEELRSDRSLLLEVLQASKAIPRHQSLLQEIPQELLKDKEVVLTAVQIRGVDLQFADVELRKDRDVVLAAVSNDAEAFQFILNPDAGPEAVGKGSREDFSIENGHRFKAKDRAKRGHRRAAKALSLRENLCVIDAALQSARSPGHCLRSELEFIKKQLRQGK